MRIHTDTLELDVLNAAAATAGVWLTRSTRHGSRARDHAFDVTLSGSHTRGQNGNPQTPAATWDEWGDFLAVCFRLDPNAIAGHYRGKSDFDWQTGAQYPLDEPRHKQHRWTYEGDETAPSGARYMLRTCNCGAVVRILLHR